MKNTAPVVASTWNEIFTITSTITTIMVITIALIGLNALTSFSILSFSDEFSNKIGGRKKEMYVDKAKAMIKTANLRSKDWNRNGRM